MINRAILVGRLTKDVELRKTPTGLSVASFTVAVNRRQAKDSQDRQADFINCVAWRGTADYLASYASKGILVGIDGKIQTRTYEDNNTGRTVYITEILVESANILEYKNKGQFENDQQFTNATYSYEGDYSNSSQSEYMDHNTSGIDLQSDDLPF